MPSRLRALAGFALATFLLLVTSAAASTHHHGRDRASDRRSGHRTRPSIARRIAAPPIGAATVAADIATRQATR
jgi:hypothetical protein